MARPPSSTTRRSGRTGRGVPLDRPTFEAELRHRAMGRRTVGVDEVGRGCLAGPVVAAAVELPSDWLEPAQDAAPGWWWELHDSKLLSPAKRERLAALVHEHALVQIAWCTVEEIDRWNILNASLEAMRRALVGFRGCAQTVLVDGHIDPFDRRYQAACVPQSERHDAPQDPFKDHFDVVETLVKGDRRSLTIAAASVVAKVYRDRWMTELAGLFPGYGFEVHKGYSTPAHYAGIASQGPCPIHRRSFAPFKTAGRDACMIAAREPAIDQDS